VYSWQPRYQVHAGRLGKNVQVTHGLGDSLQQFKERDTHYHGFSRIAAEFIDKLISHYVLDDGKLVVAHAGMKEEMQGRGSGKVREFALTGKPLARPTNTASGALQLGC